MSKTMPPPIMPLIRVIEHHHHGAPGPGTHAAGSTKPEQIGRFGNALIRTLPGAPPRPNAQNRALAPRSQLRVVPGGEDDASSAGSDASPSTRLAGRFALCAAVEADGESDSDSDSERDGSPADDARSQQLSSGAAAAGQHAASQGTGAANPAAELPGWVSEAGWSHSALSAGGMGELEKQVTLRMMAIIDHVAAHPEGAPLRGGLMPMWLGVVSAFHEAAGGQRLDGGGLARVRERLIELKRSLGHGPAHNNPRAQTLACLLPLALLQLQPPRTRAQAASAQARRATLSSAGRPLGAEVA